MPGATRSNLRPVTPYIIVRTPIVPIEVTAARLIRPMGPARVARRIYAAVEILDHKSGETIVGGKSAVVKVPSKIRSAVTVDCEKTISSDR